VRKTHMMGNDEMNEQADRSEVDGDTDNLL
jgi:hypothetical protein